MRKFLLSIGAVMLGLVLLTGAAQARDWGQGRAPRDGHVRVVHKGHHVRHGNWHRHAGRGHRR